MEAGTCLILTGAFPPVLEIKLKYRVQSRGSWMWRWGWTLMRLECFTVSQLPCCLEVPG